MQPLSSRPAAPVAPGFQAVLSAKPAVQEGFTLHELRHTYLTLLAMNGVHPKVMQELAGHYSSQITMDIYTHVNMDGQREALGERAVRHHPEGDHRVRRAAAQAHDALDAHALLAAPVDHVAH